MVLWKNDIVNIALYLIQASLSQNCNNYYTNSQIPNNIEDIHHNCIFVYSNPFLHGQVLVKCIDIQGGQLLLSIEMQPIHFYIPELPIYHISYISYINILLSNLHTTHYKPSNKINWTFYHQTTLPVVFEFSYGGLLL